MLTNLKNKIQALERFNFKDELVSIVRDNKEKIADLQASQLAKGVNSKGLTIFPQYAPFTINFKKKYGVGLGAVVDRVTYFQTGDLYKRLYAAVDAKNYTIKADSFKFDKMIERSGKDVVGLNKDSRRDFVNEITRPQILEVYKRKVTDI
jgi:hypothetical protein